MRMTKKLVCYNRFTLIALAFLFFTPQINAQCQSHINDQSGHKNVSDTVGTNNVNTKTKKNREKSNGNLHDRSDQDTSYQSK